MRKIFLLFALLLVPVMMLHSAVDPSIAFGLGGTAGFADEDPVYGGYASLIRSMPSDFIWGIDIDALWSTEDSGEFISAAQTVFAWPIEQLVSAPEHVELWIGGRAGILLESDAAPFQNTEPNTGQGSVELYPTAGVLVSARLNLNQQFGFDGRVSIDTLSATRLALSMGFFIR